MSRKYFGTDGVRGRANVFPMTAGFALSLGAAVGRYFGTDDSGRPRSVVIGKDTRLSGYMLETALTAGFTSTGMNVVLLGPVPTPAVGLLTHSMRADVGVMISASHNPAHDNGIKFFGPDGFKLSDAAEAVIEADLDAELARAQRGPSQGDLQTPSAPDAAPCAASIGRARRIDNAAGRYIEFAKTSFPRGRRLDGLKVVIDCANGAAYSAAPQVLWELGAEVIPVGVSPDGSNINAGCGSTDTGLAARTVRETGADVGICLDGDADRVMILDETGALADGDQIMGLLADRWAQAGQLRGGALVATVMSNLGLERYLSGRGLALHRTPVGDRHVVAAMRRGGFNLGGEQSGHIVMTDYATTGDGLIAGLQFLAAMIQTDRPASALARVFTPCPQRLHNVRFRADRLPLDEPSVRQVIAAGQSRLGGKGRLLIRKSGTEPLIRVMGECEDEHLLDATIADVVAAVQAAG